MTLIKKTDKIFVAGHKGMVGNSLIKVLEKNGYKNILTVNKNVVDLRNSNMVYNWFCKEKPDVTIVAAAKVGGIFANDSYPVEFLLDNLKIQNNVIESSWKTGVKRLLFLGSSCIYPKFSKQPIKEEYLLNGSLESSNQWYAIAKISGIKLCEALRKQYGFDSISLMPTNLYGPKDNYHTSNSHVIPGLIKKFHDAVVSDKRSVTCWGSGNPMREFLHVEDLAEACCFVLENWSPDLENSPIDSNGEKLKFLNVGTGLDNSIKDIALLIADVFNYKGKIKWDLTKPDGTPKKLLDVSNLKSLGWEAKIGIKEGIKRTVLEFKNELKENSLKME